MRRLLLLTWLLTTSVSADALAELRVGAAKVDISPTQLPVLVNGGMTSRTAVRITTPVHARAIVMDDGSKRIGLVVVDSCMLPTQLCDEAKQLAATQTQIRPERMLISATHTHTAPSSMGALGTDADPSYVPFLRQRLAEAMAAAESKLQPAVVGWGSAQAPEFTALRRWVLRPDRMRADPFGNLTVRATMHAASNPEDAIGPTGPEDPELSLIAFQTPEGTPLAVLANFSMHYFSGEVPISADYFGLFCTGFEQYLSGKQDSELVVAMSHGCSGDIWRRDYMQRQPVAEGSIQEYSVGLLEVAKQAHANVRYRADADLAMLEKRLPMRYRVPDAQRLEWARGVVAAMGDRLPETQPEVYAREQLLLDRMQSTEIVTQAIRIGDIAIATTPNETYALTGLKLKLQSPFEQTMVIELANGGDGYIPPPEQHLLGGYNTWAARSAGLEVTAEPRIVATNLQMLEQLSGTPRRHFQQTLGPQAEAVLEMHPFAFWRLNEFSPVVAQDQSGSNHHAVYEPGVLFFLDGPSSEQYATAREPNRCVHFAGGRMRTELPELGADFSLSLCCWNGMPLGARDIIGWMVSNDYDSAIGPRGLHLGLDRDGRLTLKLGNKEPVTGSTQLERWTWATLALVKEANQIRVYLDGRSEPEITLEDVPNSLPIPTWFFGGRSDNQDNWEGKLDEIALFDRALSPAELRVVLRGTTASEEKYIP